MNKICSNVLLERLDIWIISSRLILVIAFCNWTVSTWNRNWFSTILSTFLGCLTPNFELEILVLITYFQTNSSSLIVS